MTVSLYRRYRPGTFDEVAGQTVAVDVLKKAIIRGRVGHAYLFSGPRGCGKTTLARLLAKALNCTALKDGCEPCGLCRNCLSITAGESLDVIEIDGASNNGVEEIRELKTHVSLSPFSSKWKIYIIDEVHMLSIPAFNALLKTLEEPPAFVLFILATTEPFKVPATIRSRCQHIPFRRIEVRDISARLAEVAEMEHVSWEEGAVREIARQADGALRDALSMMEQALSLGDGALTVESVDRLLGGGALSDLERWVASAGEDSAKPFLILEEMFLKGASAQRVVEGLFLLFRNMWAWRKWGDEVLASLSVSDSEAAFLKTEAPGWTAAMLTNMMLFCSKLIPQVRSGLRSDVLTGVLAARVQELRHTAAEAEKLVLAPKKKDGPAREISGARLKPEVEPKAITGEHPPRPELAGLKPGAEPEGRKEATPRTPVSLKEEHWPGFEKMLFTRDLLLYSILAGTNISLEDRTITILFPETSAYSFELASIERNSFSLAARAAEYFGEDVCVVIRIGDKRKKCTSGGGQEQQQSAADSAIPVFGPPEDVKIFPNAEGEQQKQPPAPASSAEAGDEPAIPFQGLVEEVLKWGGGEVVMVKRDGRDEGMPYDPLTAEE